jgi:biotin carboxyl carrier protein
LPANVLDILDTWITDPEAIMRSRNAPEAVKRLIENIGYEAPDSSAEDNFDPLETQQMLQEQFPKTHVTEWDVYNYVQFGPQLGESLLKARENGIDISPLFVKNPVQYVGGAKPGDTIMFGTTPIEIQSVQDLGQGGVVVEASVGGASITNIRQPELQGAAAEAPIQLVSDTPNGIGPSQSGELYKLLVGPGAKVEKGDAVAIFTALKQESSLLAPHSGVVGSILAKKGDPFKRDQLLMTIVPDDQSNSG